MLAFEVTQGGVATIEAKYRAKHPTLLPETPTHEYPGFKILEVYAYYKGEIGGECDKGTMLRFIEKTSDSEVRLRAFGPWVVPELGRAPARNLTMPPACPCLLLLLAGGHAVCGA